MGTPLGPKYILYSYMEPLGCGRLVREGGGGADVQGLCNARNAEPTLHMQMQHKCL